MASQGIVYSYDGTKSFQLAKWKIKVGSQLFYNSTILSYKQEDGSSSDQKEPLLKYKSNVSGTVTDLLVSEGSSVQSGAALLKVQPCTHPVIMKDLCAECGTDLRNLDRDNFEKLTAAAAFSMVHVVPELKVSLEQAEKLGRDDEDRLIKNKKLVLLVDLDQTLIHTTNDIVPEKLPDVYHFQLYGANSPWYHTRLRPGTKTFLENISKYYELHICTFGARLYAHKIAQILDPDGKFFSHRILSRDECFDPTSKTANLKALFPRGDHMVCIIDDREDVWNFAPNVIHVKPYAYFRNTGDINATHLAIPTPCIQDTKKITVLTNNVPSPVLQNVDDKSKDKEVSNSEVADTVNKEVSNPEVVKTVNKEVSNPEVVKTVNKEVSNPEVANTVNKDASNPEIADTVNKEVSNPEVANTVNKEEKDNISGAVESRQEIKETKTENVNLESSVDSKNSKANEIESTSMEKKTEENKEINNSLPDLEGDDYLLYLEEILIRVHKEYYDLYEKVKKDTKKTIPDLKKVVPDVRRRTLKNVNIVFSSIVPTNCIPETHHFWTLAESLGASISRELILESSKQKTTHVIASKSGTAKVNAAKRHKSIWVVTLDWLLCCEERWEQADERMFLLPKDGSFDIENIEIAIQKHRRKRPIVADEKQKSDEEKFSERVFAEAGLALSQDEIEDMDREIENACSEDSEEESDNSNVSSDSSSSVESLSSGDYPRGWKKRRKINTLEEELLKVVAEESSDAETIGSVDEEMAEAVKQEYQNF